MKNSRRLLIIVKMKIFIHKKILKKKAVKYKRTV